MKKKVWLLRPLPHGTDHLESFLQNGFIAVGYPVGQTFEDCSYNDIRNLLAEKEWEEGLGNVNILVKDMSIGDIVVVPSTNKKDIYFGEITSDYIYDESVDLDTEGLGYPHQRKVKWLFDKTPLLRADLPNELRSSLRYPGAVADLTKHTDSVNQLLNGSSFESIDNIESKAIKVVEDLLESEDEEIRLKAAQIILSLKR
ncbi:restriction endonuclease [Lysinibacillus irui]|uniref:restriction endonuclease n=1 Tax=Lysinibacillus irui TaxID=2998077 RepID=UPI002AD52656|nr:hypothetical protein [Lysinibacillus irui]MEA0564474.1 hypothetical protein [Lysinibacillus irui]